MPRPLWAAPAAAGPADPPPVIPRIAGDGTLVLTVAPHPGAAGLWLAFRSSARVTDVTLDGAPTGLSPTPGAWSRVRWWGSDSFTLGMRGADPHRIGFVAGELVDRWLDPRPLGPVPATDQLWNLGGSSLVISPVSAPLRP